MNGNVCVLNACVDASYEILSAHSVYSGQTNGVSCYTVDLRKGLVPIPNSVRSLNQKLTTPRMLYPAESNEDGN